VLEFSLPGLDGQVVESKELRGRVTVLLFLTTFDVASQAQARRLEDLHRSHVPRLNVLGVVVEAPRYATLASEYRDSLGLSYPLVMGERAVLDAHEDLRHVHSVPAWIVLGRDGQIVSSAAGALSLDELETLVREAEKR
jgi:peroxiredoxin